MKIDILTLFPEHVNAMLHESILGRACKKGILDINCVGNLFNYLKDFYILIVGNKAGIEFNNLCLSALNLILLLHNTGPYSSHLRSEFRTSDGCYCISAKCRTGHKKLIMLLLFTGDRCEREITYIKLCTVSCKTCMDTCTYTRTKVTTYSCCTDKENIRLILFNN